MSIAAILDIKGDEVVSVAPDLTIGEAVALLASRRIGAVPVIDGDGEVQGILSERDVIYRLAEEGADLLGRRASEMMTAPAITVTREVPILAALSLMTRRRIRHLPVVEEGRLLGIVSIGDLVKRRIDMIESEAEAMRAYIQGT